jgi:hypothetical protein
MTLQELTHEIESKFAHVHTLSLEEVPVIGGFGLPDPQDLIEIANQEERQFFEEWAQVDGFEVPYGEKDHGDEEGAIERLHVLLTNWVAQLPTGPLKLIWREKPYVAEFKDHMRRCTIYRGLARCSALAKTANR